jgi:anaerobic magnesium-protoporphyrin IX monomethyl ester cyclase
MTRIPSPSRRVDVLLVFPPSRTHYSVPPVGLGYLATALRRSGFSVGVLDCTRERLTPAESVRSILERSPGIVGFQTFSYDVPAVRSLAAGVKGADPAIVTVLGGAHPSGTPETTLFDVPSADFAFAGEAETGLVLLARRILRGEPVAAGAIPGLLRREGNAIATNEPLFDENLDGLGVPAWDLIDPRGYASAPQGVFLKSPPAAPVSTSRGCPLPCAFCAGKTLTGPRIRTRSIPAVLDEIELLRRDYGVGEIHVVDDNFTADRERVAAFCEGLASRCPGTAFSFPNGVRLDTLDAGLLRLMKSAGCYSLILGIESGSDRVLRLMRKGLTTERIRRGIALVREAGIEVGGFFILGFPGETREEMGETIRFSRSLGLTSAHFSNFIPLPGTEACRALCERGELGPIDWSRLFYADTPYVPPGLTAAELKSLQRRAYLGFYLRPSVLWGLRRRVRSWSQVRAIARRLADYLFAP